MPRVPVAAKVRPRQVIRQNEQDVRAVLVVGHREWRAWCDETTKDSDCLCEEGRLGHCVGWWGRCVETRREHGVDIEA